MNKDYAILNNDSPSCLVLSDIDKDETYTPSQNYSKYKSTGIINLNYMMFKNFPCYLIKYLIKTNSK